jgi:Protein of unknown function (DUF2808)
MIRNYFARPLSLSLMTSLTVVTLLVSVAGAVTLRDGKTYFEKPPRLRSSTTTQDGSYIWGASYFFTVEIPEKAGEPLSKIVIVQETGQGQPQFNPDKAEVFEGTRENRGDRIKTQSIEMTEDPTTITVTFDPPVPPGKTVTLRLYPVRNPQVGGIYLYRVTAVPAGEQPHSQFLGFGRIRIVDRNRD